MLTLKSRKQVDNLYFNCSPQTRACQIHYKISWSESVGGNFCVWCVGVGVGIGVGVGVGLRRLCLRGTACGRWTGHSSSTCLDRRLLLEPPPRRAPQMTARLTSKQQLLQPRYAHICRLVLCAFVSIRDRRQVSRVSREYSDGSTPWAEGGRDDIGWVDLKKLWCSTCAISILCIYIYIYISYIHTHTYGFYMYAYIDTERTQMQHLRNIYLVCV